MAKSKTSRFYTLTGAVLDPAGAPLAALIVRAFDQDPSGENPLGQTETNEKGAYSIPYTDEAFRIGGKESGGADIIVRVYEGDTLLAESEPLRNADEQAIVNIVVEKRQTPPRPVLNAGQERRLEGLSSILENDVLRGRLRAAFEAEKGNWEAAVAKLGETKDFDERTVGQLKFAHQVAELTEDRPALIHAFHTNQQTNNLRDIALGYNRTQLADLILQSGALENEPGTEAPVKAQSLAQQMNTQLFLAEPTAVLQRMAGSAEESPIADRMMSGSVATFLGNQPADFNIKTTSVYAAFEAENAFKGIAPELQEQVMTEMKALQRVAALSPAPEVLPALMRANMNSAYRISEMPAAQFMQAFSREWGEEGEALAKQIHNNAVNARIRNEQALIALKEVREGTGVAFIDKSLHAADASVTPVEYGPNANVMRFDLAKVLAAKLKANHLSWDLLFGDADLCECGECNSVYSPAAYFVELLQYLRNNNLDPDATGTIAINTTNPKSISGTPLEKFFKRRPDLGCLELTCNNSFTILPYADLVNEVMENYVAFKHLKPFNVKDEASSELLAQPQHTEYQAYCILKDEVYPFTLPYHQPIDAIRIYLDSLGTSRHELIDTFRAARKTSNDPENTDIDDCNDPAAPNSTLDEYHTQYLDRAADAEFLGLTQEEYVILTKEAFVSKAYWDKQCNTMHTDEEYRKKIGVKPVHEYYGYATEAEMLDDNAGLGLTFVKDQFLPRTGIQYTDLVALLLTECLNPNMPRGRAKVITDQLHFSYRFLQNYKAANGEDKLIEVLTNSEKLVELLPQLAGVATFFGPGQQNALACPPDDPEAFTLTPEDIKHWVKCHFERIGKMIVLENGSKCQCTEGRFLLNMNPNVVIPIYLEGSDGPVNRGYLSLNSDCDIIFQPSDGSSKSVIGRIEQSTGVLIAGKFNGKTVDFNQYTLQQLPIDFKTQDNRIGRVKNGNLLEVSTGLPFQCQNESKDTCDLDTVRLIHLDGTSVTVDEFDKIHRFIRLWRKMGWTIDEVDKSLVGLSQCADDCLGEEMPETDDCNDCGDLFDGPDPCNDCEEDCDDCGDASSAKAPCCDITPAYLHELVAVKQLLDKTGIELPKLLTFWTNISTQGEKSLYKRLFLTHNLLGMDKVFKADKNGNFLSGPDKLSGHYPVLMAAFNLSTEDIESIVQYAELNDRLSLSNLSVLYRFRLLAQALGLRIPAFLEALPLFGDPFKSAHSTLTLLEHWGKMEDAGFTYRQLNYIIRDYDDPKKPLAPSEKAVLQLAKTIYDGLNAIEEAHKDVPADLDIEQRRLLVTTELVKSKATLLFDPVVAAQISDILEGTSVFATNAPKELAIVSDKLNPQKDIPNVPVPEVLKSLRKKAKYDAKIGSLQITGILTDSEAVEIKSWVNNPEWSNEAPRGTIQRLEKQAQKRFKTVLEDVFAIEKDLAEKKENTARIEALNEANKTITTGDINIPFEEIPEGQNDPNTAFPKREAFLEIFLPYLRRELTHRFIVDTLANAVGLERKITDVLISEVLQSGTPAEPIYAVFEKIKESAQPNPMDWQGYLIPGAEGDYTFIVKDGSTTTPPALSLDGAALKFEQEEDPNNEWWSKQKNHLQAGQLYKLSFSGNELKNLYWKTATSAISAVPTPALLPDFASDACTPALALLKKAAMLVGGFILSADELRYFNSHSADFAGLDFNQIKPEHWLRLEAYTRLRNSLPESKMNILTFFAWTSAAQEAAETAKLSEKIAELTLWKKERVDKLLAPTHFNLNDPAQFRNEINLLKLQKALQVADKIGMDVNLLFDWARPTSNFKKTRAISDNIEKAIRAQYKQTDWEQVVKPLSDKLRNNQRDALIAYLLQQPELKAFGVTDADGLFEYFLIDVQMDACMETSRIKQAISSVQLFVQRCFLGLEKAYSNIGPEVLDRDRWEWMSRYRVWEANRKVFLYPENWIESNLRDDKSPFFKELESELLQKDINKQNVTDALKNYLYKVDEVANMEVVGLYIENEKYEDKNVNKLHVFSRTRNAPYFFYYRYFDILEGNWYPWEKVQVDIPSYDVEDANGAVTGNGCYLTPVVWNGRLLIFFPQFIKKTKPLHINNKILAEDDGLTLPAGKTQQYWEIKISWSEYRNKKWTQKQLSKEAIYEIPDISAELANYVNAGARKSDKLKALNQAAEKVRDLESAMNNAKNSQAMNQNPLTDSNVIVISNALMNARPDQVNALIDFGKAKDAFNEAESNLLASISNINLISNYEFLAVLSDDTVEEEKLLGIKVFYENIEKGVFEFNGSFLQVRSKVYSSNNSLNVNRFHYNGDKIQSLQVDGGDAYVFQDSNFPKYNSSNFYWPFTHDLLGKINAGKLGAIFSYISNKTDKSEAFGEFDNDGIAITPGIYHELKRPYSLYNWELFFHTPIMLADALSKAQQFEEAMKWYNFVFDPIAEGVNDKRFWQFAPFKDLDSQRILDQIFNRLQPNETDTTINEWRNKPFMPHVVARSRPVAYMKWVVMKYTDNLLAWGDYLFRQDTIESINEATQLYVLALHILGPRPMFIPKRGKIRPQTYVNLLDRWDAFSNAMVELELTAPYSNQITTPIGSSNGVQGFANVFGFSTALYFCIPNNPKLMGYWDTLSDRLFKIRHCQNIEGVFRKLPLFEPPIDPALLVKAAAQGLSISSVLNDLNTPMPNYRFYYLLQKALELCGELKSMGGAILAAIEKLDNEKIALLRAKHEKTMHNLVMEVKKVQLDEAQKSLETLEQNRKAPEHRMKYYLKLIGEDLGKVPGVGTPFNEIANSIEAPVEESGLKLIKYEKEELDKSNQANDWQIAIGVSETLASILHIIPSFEADAKPFGIGMGSTITSGWMLGNAAQAVARGLQMVANQLTFDSTNASKKSGFTRALQDRIQQANAAGYEIQQIDKQITAQQIRIQISNLEITNQQQQIDNAVEIEEFLKNKYSNEELYTWMQGSLKTLYRQTYNLAYELAKKAEKVYRFERGLTNSNFVQSGYWDAGREGLLAGESLYVALKQLEAAYQENRGYDYEITKHVSLRQINPWAVLQLKETGKCEFNLPELLLDLDYPGHYKRRIKSVSLSIPCVAGPYTGINATLRLLQNKFRYSNIANNYSEKTEEVDDRFQTNILPINAIAASSAQNDSGMFELNFKDERYLPFEGAGAISQWRLELPAFRQFDYDSISDVVIHLRYTASEGGERLKKAATDSALTYIEKVEELSQQEGLFSLIDLQHDLPTEWHKAMQVKPGDTIRKLELKNVQDFLPYFARMKDGKERELSKIVVTDLWLIHQSELGESDFSLIIWEDEPLSFNPGSKMGGMKVSVLSEQALKLGEWALTINNPDKVISKAQLLLRFVLMR